MLVPGTSILLEILERANVDRGFEKNGKRIEIPLSPFEPQMEYPSDSILIPMDQPYGAFAKAMLENQSYPNLLDDQKHPIPPYDVTAHTLSQLLGNNVETIMAPFQTTFILKIKITRARGDCITDGFKETGLYRSAIPSMDEGWTRWLLGTCWENEPVQNADIRAGNFTPNGQRFGFLSKDVRKEKGVDDHKSDLLSSPTNPPTRS